MPRPHDADETVDSAGVDGADDLELIDDDEGTSLARLRRLARCDEASEGGDRTARDELLSALQAPSEVWRLTALQGLARRESPEDLAPLAAALLGSSLDPFLQAQSRLLLARAGRGDVVDLARRALGRRGVVDEARWPVRPALARRAGLGWPLRRLATLALGHAARHDAPAARAALRGVLADDPDWAVREAAAEALGTLGRATTLDDEDRRGLEAALADRRGAVRRAAARALARDPGTPIEDAWDAWRVPRSEPYFRYVGGHARRDYRDELVRTTRDALGLNWAPFGVDLEEDDVPDDVDPAHPLVRALAIPRDDALTRARDLTHQPGITWAVDPLWPVCCNDYAVFQGHDALRIAPRGEDPDDWFLEALEPELPYPEEALEDLEAETFAFRCGWCGWWWTSYRE